MINKKFLEAAKAAADDLSFASGFLQGHGGKNKYALRLAAAAWMLRMAIVAAEPGPAVKPTVLVVLEGGLVRDIFCTHPLDVQTDIFDFDTLEGGEDAEEQEYRQAHGAAGNIEVVAEPDGGSQININTDKYPYVLTAEGPRPSKEGGE